MRLYSNLCGYGWFFLKTKKQIFAIIADGPTITCCLWLRRNIKSFRTQIHYFFQWKHFFLINVVLRFVDVPSHHCCANLIRLYLTLIICGWYFKILVHLKILMWFKSFIIFQPFHKKNIRSFSWIENKFVKPYIYIFQKRMYIMITISRPTVHFSGKPENRILEETS